MKIIPIIISSFFVLIFFKKFKIIRSTFKTRNTKPGKGVLHRRFPLQYRANDQNPLGSVGVGLLPAE